MHASSRLRVVVQAIRPEAQGMVSAELRSPTGDALPPFEAGAHVDPQPAEWLGPKLFLVQLSCRTLWLHGRRVERPQQPKWLALHARTVAGGSTLEISAPRNHFALDEFSPKARRRSHGWSPLLKAATQLGWRDGDDDSNKTAAAPRDVTASGCDCPDNESVGARSLIKPTLAYPAHRIVDGRLFATETIHSQYDEPVLQELQMWRLLPKNGSTLVDFGL
jgi:hypothetical protein